MNDQVTFYYNPMSMGRIVYWMLEESGARFEVKILDMKNGEHKSPEYLKINPMGKIPAIVHRGVTVTETAAILCYLADAFPEAKLAPAVTDPDRGTFYRWMFFVINCVIPAIADRANPRTKEVPPMSTPYGTYEDTMKTLRVAIETGFIVNGKFSAVDVFLAANLGWSMHMKSIEPSKVLTDYVARCTDRPAYQRFMQKSPLPI